MRFEIDFAFLNCSRNWSVYAKSGISYLHELGWKPISTYKILGLHDFSDWGADLLKAYQSPSPSSRCLLMHLALERYLQILGVRPESRTLSSLGYNQLVFLYSF